MYFKSNLSNYIHESFICENIRIIEVDVTYFQVIGQASASANKSEAFGDTAVEVQNRRATRLTAKQRFYVGTAKLPSASH